MYLSNRSAEGVSIVKVYQSDLTYLRQDGQDVVIRGRDPTSGEIFQGFSQVVLILIDQY